MGRRGRLRARLPEADHRPRGGAAGGAGPLPARPRLKVSTTSWRGRLPRALAEVGGDQGELVDLPARAGVAVEQPDPRCVASTGRPIRARVRCGRNRWPSTSAPALASGGPGAGGRPAQLLLVAGSVSTPAKRTLARPTFGNAPPPAIRACIGLRLRRRPVEPGHQVVVRPVGDVRRERQREVPLVGHRPPERRRLPPRREELLEVLDHVLRRDHRHEHAGQAALSPADGHFCVLVRRRAGTCGCPDGSPVVPRLGWEAERRTPRHCPLARTAEHNCPVGVTAKARSARSTGRGRGR